MSKNLTLEQKNIVAEFVQHHGLEARQISFDGDSLEPIFDYEALNYLRFKLTDIESTAPQIEERNEITGFVTARCVVVLPCGRSSSDLGTAQVNEKLHDGSHIENLLEAQNVAIARALRRAIRSVGVNLFKAHREWLETGQPVTAEVDPEFVSAIGKEIHKLANEWGHISGRDKTKYQEFIERMFGAGKRSTLDLNDIEKSQLANIYRQMLNSKNLAELPQKLAA